MSTFRMYATKDQPFLVAVQTETGATVTIAITDPLGAADPVSPLTLLDPDGDGLYTANFTPDQVGAYILTISSSVTGIDGLISILQVSGTAQFSFAGGQSYSSGSCEPGGANLRWPCPTLASLPCINAYTIDQINRWADVATSTMFDDTCRRFPGCDNYAKIRPVVGSRCLGPLPPHYPQALGLDLWPTLRYPVVELCDIEIDGASIKTVPDDPVPGWRVEGKRWLVPEGTTAWPTQDLHEPDGAAGTWSVTVRFGRPAPNLAVAGRDQLMLALLLGNEVPGAPTGEVCTLENGLVQLTENGRTQVIDPETATRIQDEVTKRWKCRPRRETSTMSDPAERSAAGSHSMHVVPGDHTPAAAQAFFASGCDLAAQLAAI